MVNVRISFPGSCGEFVQGIFNNTDCLVSCTIDKTVTLEVIVTNGTGNIIVPDKMQKTQIAISKTLEYCNETNVDVQIKRIKSLPVEKGYASSSADIFAAIYGLTKAMNKNICKEDILKIAISIEPTDSILWKELTLQSYKDEIFVKQLGHIPPLAVLVFNFGKDINTISYNNSSHSQIDLTNENIIKQAFELFIEGVSCGDINKIGEASTMSALANQNSLFKPELNEIIRFADDVNAAGVCVAHSGSLIGVLSHPDKISSIAEQAEHIFGSKSTFDIHTVIQGGPHFEN